MFKETASVRTLQWESLLYWRLGRVEQVSEVACDPSLHWAGARDCGLSRGMPRILESETSVIVLEGFNSVEHGDPICLCVCACVCAGPHRGQRRVLDSPVTAIVSCLIGVGSGIQVLCKSSKCSTSERPLQPSICLWKNPFGNMGLGTGRRGYVGDELDCSEREMVADKPQGAIVIWQNGWILEVFRK